MGGPLMGGERTWEPAEQAEGPMQRTDSLRPGRRQECAESFVSVWLSSGNTLMEAFGAWDRSQQQKWPPGMIECPPTHGPLGCWLQSSVPRSGGTVPLPSSGHQRPADKSDLVLTPGPILGVNLLMTCYLIDIHSHCHMSTYHVYFHSLNFSNGHNNP